MTKSEINRMTNLDTEIRNLIAHEGIGSPAVAELLTEQEALLALWLANAEAKHNEHLSQ
jgi:hypothetical protein